jgi:tripartite-type tricarboxylate transporter receptor subunit TctC
MPGGRGRRQRNGVRNAAPRYDVCNFYRVMLMRILVAAVILLAPLASHAQAYPAKPIRTIMTLGAGGSAESAARAIGLKLNESMGQPILIEAHGGAGGAVGADMVARAAPDGYTLLFGTTSALVLRRFLVKNVPYDAERDFTPLIQVGETISCVVAGPAVPGTTLADAVEFAKRNPNKVSYGSSGIGTTHHLSGAMIEQLQGVKMIHVPYKSGAQGVIDTVSGRIGLMFGTLGTMTPQVGPGKLKLLAVNNGRRFSKMPEVPTINELIPGYDRPPSWVGYLGPAGLPQPLVQRLHGELNKAILHPDTVERLLQQGILADTSTPAEFAAFIRKNMEVAGKMMRAAGIQPE